MDTRKADLWTSFYRNAMDTGTGLSWPSETLVRLFRGNYVPGLDKDFKGKKLLDVGFGNANNLLFLGTLGLELHGTEVSQEICDFVGTHLKSLNCEADLRPGTNQSLPYPDNEFDFLVSWNVLHYETTESDIHKGLAEYKRVLKPQGRLFLSTTGPESAILENSTTLGGHRYQIGREGDFRKGQIFFYFDAPNYVKFYFEQHFANVLVGRTHDFILTSTQDWFIVSAVKE